MPTNFILFKTIEDFTQWLSKQTIKRAIDKIQNHHTYIPGYEHWSKKPDAVYWCKSMETSHIQRGFSQIGQNLTTFPDGSIVVCRPFETIPAAIKGANTGSIAIEHLGYFDLGKDQMTEAHKETIVGLNAALAKKFGLPVDENHIIYHHWYDLNTGKRTNGAGSTKSCPGNNFFGGNNVEAAKQNFYPLIKSKL